jgi:hypothetical protein
VEFWVLFFLAYELGCLCNMLYLSYLAWDLLTPIISESIRSFVCPFSISIQRSHIHRLSSPCMSSSPSPSRNFPKHTHTHKSDPTPVISMIQKPQRMRATHPTQSKTTITKKPNSQNAPCSISHATRNYTAVVISSTAYKF